VTRWLNSGDQKELAVSDPLLTSVELLLNDTMGEFMGPERISSF